MATWVFKEPIEKRSAKVVLRLRMDAQCESPANSIEMTRSIILRSVALLDQVQTQSRPQYMFNCNIRETGKTTACGWGIQKPDLA